MIEVYLRNGGRLFVGYKSLLTDEFRKDKR